MDHRNVDDPIDEGSQFEGWDEESILNYDLKDLHHEGLSVEDEGESRNRFTASLSQSLCESDEVGFQRYYGYECTEQEIVDWRSITGKQEHDFPEPEKIGILGFVTVNDQRVATCILSAPDREPREHEINDDNVMHAKNTVNTEIHTVSVLESWRHKGLGSLVFNLSLSRLSEKVYFEEGKQLNIIHADDNTLYTVNINPLGDGAAEVTVLDEFDREIATDTFTPSPDTDQFEKRLQELLERMGFDRVGDPRPGGSGTWNIRATRRD